MKIAKNMLAVVLVFSMLLATLVIPASALDSDWQARFKGMETITSTSAKQYPEYVKAVQSYMFCNPGTRGSMGSTHVDGVWGVRTESSVRVFQDAYGLGIDGKVGPNTWGKIAYTLDPLYSNYNGANCRILYIDNNDSYWYAYLVNVSNSMDYAYYYYYHTNQFGNQFDENNFFHSDL